jgi:tetratricopeptide (TPR) repeat protein
LHYTKARADRFRNAKEDGLLSVRKAIELKPDYAEAYLLLGDLLGIGGKNFAEQITAFRKAIELKPDLLPAYSELGRVLEYSGDEKGAIDAYQKAISLDPNKSAGLFDLGRLLVKQNRLKEARDLWEKRPPDSKDKTFPNFITVLERAEKQEAARVEYEKNANDPDALVRMGLATMDGDHWVVDGRQEKAIVYFRKALAIKPSFAMAQHAICKAYVQIADAYKSKNKELDEELTKLRTMDSKLADEIVEYRKTYQGGLRGVPAGPPPPKKP